MSNPKLSNKFHRPFQVIAVVGKVAYKLKLPLKAKIHNVFHVSQLKLFHAQLLQVIHISTWLQGTDPMIVPSKLPECILDRRIVKVDNGAHTQYLVKWLHMPVEDATWLVADTFTHQFPTFLSGT